MTRCHVTPFYSLYFRQEKQLNSAKGKTFDIQTKHLGMKFDLVMTH